MKRYKWLIPYVKPFFFHLTIVLLLALLSTALTLSYPYFTSMLIDDVLIRHTYSLKVVVSLAFGTMFMGYLLTSVNSLLYLRITLTMLRNVRRDLLVRIQKTKFQFFVHRKVGDIITRLNGDAAEVQGGLTDVILQGMIQVCTLSFVAFMLFWLNWKLALMSIVFVPFLIVAIFYFRPKIVTVSKEMREQHSILQSFLIERLNGIKLIKLAVGEKRVADEFDDQVEQINKKSFQYSLLTTFAEGVPKITIILTSVMIFSWGGLQVLDNHMTVGALIAFTGYQSRLFGPVQSIAALYMRLQRMNVSLKRLEELFAQTSEEDEKESLVEEKKQPNIKRRKVLAPLLEFQQVSFQYQLNKPVLQDVTLSLRDGEAAAIIGKSGIGKSTMIDLMTGIIRPTKGTIYFQGLSLDDWPLEDLRKEISVASQQAPLFNGTIADNIRFHVPMAPMDEVIEIAKLVGIHEQIIEMEEGYDTMVGERGAALSGGQRQRIALARTLLKPATLYILDEATSELDERSEIELYRRLSEDVCFKQMLIISHRPRTLEWVDVKWHVMDGKIYSSEVGLHEETVG